MDFKPLITLLAIVNPLAIVPFFMRGIRPRFCPPLPGISDFLELNVRTYVRDAQGRHGVWFYSLDCDQSLAVWTARTFFHLPYQHARMSATVSGPRVDYHCQRRHEPAKSRFTWSLDQQTRNAEPGTLEFFLAERYLLFTQDKEGQVLCGQVHHAPYPLRAAEVLALDQGLLAAAGLPTTGAQAPALYSPGVDVEIFPLRPHLPRAPR